MRLLLVEDNARLASLIREGLDRQGFAVDWCETVDGAEHALKLNDYDLLLLDLGLPDGNGLELLDELQQQRPGLPVAVLSASEMDGHELAGVSAALAKSRNDGQHFLHILNRLLPAKETRHD